MKKEINKQINRIKSENKVVHRCSGCIAVIENVLNTVHMMKQ